jgi:hypothetical protein
MKKLNLIIISLTISIALAGCSKLLDDSKNSPDNVQTKSIQDSPAPYPVANADRAIDVDELVELRKKMIHLEGKLIAPTKEDLDSYSHFLKKQNTGLARLFSQNDSGSEREPLLLPGGGSYYQFKGRTNEYGYNRSDIRYSTAKTTDDQPTFSVLVAGVNFGFFAQLGKTDIRRINETNPSVSFALSYPTMNGQDEPAWRAEQKKWAYTGVLNGDVLFKDTTEAIVGMSYVVRSVKESDYDIVAIFQVIRRDPTDGSLVIAWKILKEFEKPVLKRN